MVAVWFAQSLSSKRNYRIALGNLRSEIITNTKFGKDISISDLQSDYDALFVGVGAHQEQAVSLIAAVGVPVMKVGIADFRSV